VDTFVDNPSVLVGGSGDDYLIGATTEYGGPGDDEIHEADYGYGGTGDDAVDTRIQGYGESGNDTVDAPKAYGGTGNDKVHAAGGVGKAYGEDGDDSLYGDFLGQVLIGGPGRDTYVYEGTGLAPAVTIDYSARTAPVTVTADGVANDGEAGEHDNVGPGAWIILGGSGNDKITGKSSYYDLGVYLDYPVRLIGNGGNDTLTSARENDTLLGGAGNDVLTADFGDDQVEGGSGTDVLYGDGDDDTLLGGDGIDALHGGPGDDLLAGNTLHTYNTGDAAYGDSGTDTCFAQYKFGC
jgi:Ca2+-binding RTX toxin-like protein